MMIIITIMMMILMMIIINTNDINDRRALGFEDGGQPAAHRPGFSLSLFGLISKSCCLINRTTWFSKSGFSLSLSLLAADTPFCGV